MNLTNPSRFYIYAQICDIATTAVGLRLGCYESNPLGFTPALVLSKLFLTGIIILILGTKLLPTYIEWLPPVVASLAVIWNIGIIGIQIWL